MAPKEPSSESPPVNVATCKVQYQLGVAYAQITVRHESSHMLLVGDIARPHALSGPNLFRRTSLGAALRSGISDLKGFEDFSRIDAKSLNLPAQFITLIGTLGTPHSRVLRWTDLGGVLVTPTVNKDDHGSLSAARLARSGTAEISSSLLEGWRNRANRPRREDVPTPQHAFR